MAERKPLVDCQLQNTIQDIVVPNPDNSPSEVSNLANVDDRNKENPTKARASILAKFDPLYSESPRKVLSVGSNLNLFLLEEADGNYNEPNVENAPNGDQLINIYSPNKSNYFDASESLNDIANGTFDLRSSPANETFNKAEAEVSTEQCIHDSTFDLKQSDVVQSDNLVEESSEDFIENLLGNLLSQLHLNDTSTDQEPPQTTVEQQATIDVSTCDNTSNCATDFVNIGVEETESAIQEVTEEKSCFETKDTQPDNQIGSTVFALGYSIAEALLHPTEFAGQSDADLNNAENIIQPKELVSHIVKSPSSNQLLNSCDKAMSDLTDVVNLQEQDICDLKLQLNQSQQARASLELQARQSEELVIKTQAEAQKKEQSYRQEIKQLQEKLSAKDDISNQDARVRELQELQTKLKSKEEQILGQLKTKNSEATECKLALEEYEKHFRLQKEDSERVKHEYATTKKHLANLEIAFSDVHQKYERCKTIIEGYKNNEEILCEDLRKFQDTIRKQDERYDSLKAHAKAQIDKCNQEIHAAKDKYDIDVTKLNAIIKRMQIKLESVTNLLNQKTIECEGLAELCDEVTGKVK